MYAVVWKCDIFPFGKFELDNDEEVERRVAYVQINPFVDVRIMICLKQPHLWYPRVDNEELNTTEVLLEAWEAEKLER